MAEGDAVDVLAGEAGSATPEYMEELGKNLGLITFTSTIRFI